MSMRTAFKAFKVFIDKHIDRYPHSASVLFFVILRLCGGQSKRISIDQLQLYTGLSRPSVINGIKFLLDDKVIRKTKDNRAHCYEVIIECENYVDQKPLIPVIQPPPKAPKPQNFYQLDDQERKFFDIYREVYKSKRGDEEPLLISITEKRALTMLSKVEVTAAQFRKAATGMFDDDFWGPQASLSILNRRFDVFHNAVKRGTSKTPIEATKAVGLERYKKLLEDSNKELAIEIATGKFDDRSKISYAAYLKTKDFEGLNKLYYFGCNWLEEHGRGSEIISYDWISK